jgi:hypothetical protein
VLVLSAIALATVGPINVAELPRTIFTIVSLESPAGSEVVLQKVKVVPFGIVTDRLELETTTVVPLAFDTPIGTVSNRSIFPRIEDSC